MVVQVFLLEFIIIPLLHKQSPCSAASFRAAAAAASSREQPAAA